MNILCKLGFHKFGKTEVHFGEIPKAVCKASILDCCTRKGCSHKKIVRYQRPTEFILPLQSNVPVELEKDEYNVR